MSTSKTTASKARLRHWEARYAALKRSLLPIGYILPGSIIKRFIPCGKPSCRCAAGHRHHHGPYYQWSLALRGKPVTRRLSAQQARLYQEWTGNNQKVRRILAGLRAISMRVAKRQARLLIVGNCPSK